MASGGEDSPDSYRVLLREFEQWQGATSSEAIFLLEPLLQGDGSVQLSMLLGGEHEFKLRCPSGYPECGENFFVEADQTVTSWCNALNEFLLDAPTGLTLKEVLSRAAHLYQNGERMITDHDSEEEMSMEDEEENEDMILSDDDSAFTTEWELDVARKKKRWAQKEKELRKAMESTKQIPGNADFGAIKATKQERVQAQQIFTSTAASGILTNDLVKIMECEQEAGFTADPIDDNIYQWLVKMYNFQSDSDLAKDLADIKKNFGYDYIELEMDFTIDLYPFYPPLVKVVRPRLQGSMMQRVTNMEILKLSYWNATKDMQSVLMDIKNFLQQWARLEVNSERNDMKKYPGGAYVDIEHHLLRLALVSEVNPRANIKYQVEVERAPEVKPTPSKEKDRKKEEYWAPGTGYGHGRRPEWDIKAYVAAQKEKDKQIEAVLHKILQELKVLYANHAPQLKPRVPRQAAPPTTQSECVDPVEDMFNILEGSALVPFMESYLKADSFLEICRHTSVYKVIVDVIKEIALQAQLLPLVCKLPGQSQSLYDLLKNLESKANVLLQHMCKVGNGSIPKPPRREREGKKSKDKGGGGEVLQQEGPSTSAGHPTQENSAEEKLAREFLVLFKDVTEALSRNAITPDGHREGDRGDAEIMDIHVSTDEQDVIMEGRYKKVLKEFQFDSYEMEVEGQHCHHYANELKRQGSPSQAQVFRIAQEVTSLSSSLPLDLSSSIFVRSDDEKLVMMRALITGPESTPYSGGCFQFDIFFPQAYPKVPPWVNLQTTGGGTVRFNPNLYNCGKVCLSLLGTWEGQQGEQWNETTSTVLQVLVSIQSLILVAEPYFNEPGYEQEIGTEAGKVHSGDYNADVRVNNIKYAMVSQLQNPSPGFEDVIKSHFYLKKDRILKEVEAWLQEDKSSRLERAYNNLKQELNKLQPPASLVNVLNSKEAN